MKPEIRLFQTADAENYPQMLDISAVANRRYCELHGFGFDSFVGFKRGYFPWHAAFNRIVYLKEQIDAGYEGWIFYVDADAFVYGQGFDVKHLVASGEGDFYFAPGGLTGQKWDVNAGVFLIDLGSIAGKALAEAWYAHFMETPEQALMQAKEWSSVPDDQERLHDILIHQPELLDRLAMVPRAMFNDEHACFVRQVLRANAANFDQRLDKLRAGVAEALSRPLDDAEVRAALAAGPALEGIEEVQARMRHAELAGDIAEQAAPGDAIYNGIMRMSAGDALGLAHRYALANKLPAATGMAEMALARPGDLGGDEANARVLLASLRERQDAFEAAARSIAEAVRLAPDDPSIKADQQRILAALSASTGGKPC